MMQIRSKDPTSAHYEQTTNFGEIDLVPKKMKGQKQFDQRQQKREEGDYKRGQKSHYNCKECFYNYDRRSQYLFDTIVTESDHWCVMYPSAIKPLGEDGTHLQLIPKAHYASSVDLDEDVFRDLKSL